MKRQWSTSPREELPLRAKAIGYGRPSVISGVISKDLPRGRGLSSSPIPCIISSRSCIEQVSSCFYSVFSRSRDTLSSVQLDHIDQWISAVAVVGESIIS